MMEKGILKIGLTGGIGSGKSTVSAMIKNKGIPVVDADLVAREVLYIYPEILQQVREIFGEKFINEQGELKRREFGNFIFKYKDKRIAYEKIIMPFIIKESFNKVHCIERQGKKICVLDAPTLIEQGLYKDMDFNILVWVDKNTQISRVMQRDNLNKQQVVNRMVSQIPMEQKIKLVDFIIDNSKDLNNTKLQIDEILELIKSKLEKRGGVL